MRQLFQDSDRDKQYKEDGFIKLQLPDSSLVGDLKKIVAEIAFSYDNNVNRERCSYNSTLFDASAERRIKLFNAVAERVQPLLDRLLIDFDIAMVNYWSKDHNDGAVEIHQNWSHVDETKFNTLSIWIPLQDTNHYNGTMEVVPKSHGKYDLIRGINIMNPLLDISHEIVANDLVAVNLKAGEAILFNDNLVHYTAPNKSDLPREAVQLVIKPKEAQALFYFRWLDRQENNVEIFDATPPFYSQLQVKSAFTGPPEFGKSLGFTTYHNQPLTYAEFKKALLEPQPAV